MLSAQDNETLCRVGPGTPMGVLLRQFWTPAIRSDELPSIDGPPLRVKLLGENLIAFRATSGKVGLIQDACPHRGASMFFGRNEEEGLRCVYHGWKFDSSGACVDMPSEPTESNFKNKVRARAYPTEERNGILWAYMGPRSSGEEPPLPQLEANMVEGAVVNTVLRDCNWMQALEGDIDTVHFIFLHYGHLKLQDTYEGGFFNLQVKSPASEYAVANTDFGTCYGAYRPAEEDTNYWRIANFLFPFYTQVPPGTLAVKRQFRAWVPLDDDHTLFWLVSAPTDADVENDPERQKRSFKRVQEIVPDTTGWYGRSRPKAQANNDYLLDREFQNSGESYIPDTEGFIPLVHLERRTLTTGSKTFTLRHQPDTVTGSERQGLTQLLFRTSVFDAVEVASSANQVTTGSTSPVVKNTLTTANTGSPHDYVYLIVMGMDHTVQDVNLSGYGDIRIGGSQVLAEEVAIDRSTNPYQIALGYPERTSGNRTVESRYWAESGQTAVAQYAHILALRYKEPGTSLGAEE